MDRKYVGYEQRAYPTTDAERMEYLLEHYGLTQAQFSHKTGIVQSTVSMIYNGKRVFTREHANVICQILKVKPSFFISICNNR